MGEQLFIEGSHGRDILFTIIRSVLIGEGNFGKIYRNTGKLSLESGRTRLVGIITKMIKLNSSTQIGELVKHNKASYEACKRAGIPVPNFFRLVKNDAGEIVGITLSDLVQCSTQVTFSSNEVKQLLGYEMYGSAENLEVLKSHLANKNITNELRKQLDAIVDLATKNRILLSYDSYFVILENTGKFKVVVGDFDNVFVNNRSNNLQGSNSFDSNRFVDDLQLIYEKVIPKLKRR